jgi:hypothetical protein
MGLTNSFFPMRAVIRCQAKQQLLQEPECEELCFAIDEALLKELTMTVFQAERYTALYRECHTQARASEIEAEMAIAVAGAYKRIKLQQANPFVQQLNALLG